MGDAVKRFLVAVGVVIVASATTSVVVYHSTRKSRTAPDNLITRKSPNARALEANDFRNVATPLAASASQKSSDSSDEDRSKSQSEIRNPADIQRLLQVLNDRAGKPEERILAADALGMQRRQEAYESFLSILKDASEPEVLRYKAARGLGVLKDERAIPTLTSILEDQGADRHLRIVSALALGNLGNEACVEPLSRAAEDQDSLIRFKAVEGLERTQKKSALKSVERALDDPDLYVQARAIHALGKMGGESSVQTISGILNSAQSDFVRIACLTALGSAGGAQAMTILHEYQRSSDQLLRLNAQAGLTGLEQRERLQP